MAKRRLNKRLLRKIRDHILEEPKRYDQGSYGDRVEPEEGGPECGTVACLAGWALVLSGKPLFLERYPDTTVSNVANKASKLCGIEREDGYGVFSSGISWPDKFHNRLINAKTKRGKASAAAAYLDYIIETGKVD